MTSDVRVDIFYGVKFDTKGKYKDTLSITPDVAGVSAADFTVNGKHHVYCWFISESRVMSGDLNYDQNPVNSIPLNQANPEWNHRLAEACVKEGVTPTEKPGWFVGYRKVFL